MPLARLPLPAHMPAHQPGGVGECCCGLESGNDGVPVLLHQQHTANHFGPALILSEWSLRRPQLGIHI